MEEEQNGAVDTSNQQEEEVLETSNEESSEQEEGESIEEYKARLTKAEELAKNYRIRAEKAERFAKERPKESAPSGDLTTKDLYALMESKVPQEDIDEVRDYAKLKGISISEALKTSVVKSILSEKSEQRNVAKASNTGTTRRSSKLSDEMLLENLKKGVLPETDEDIARLVRIKK